MISGSVWNGYGLLAYDLMLSSWLVGPFLASFWLRSRFCWAFAPCDKIRGHTSKMVVLYDCII